MDACFTTTEGNDNLGDALTYLRCGIAECPTIECVASGEEEGLGLAAGEGEEGETTADATHQCVGANVLQAGITQAQCIV